MTLRVSLDYLTEKDIHVKFTLTQDKINSSEEYATNMLESKHPPEKRDVILTIFVQVKSIKKKFANKSINY